MDAERFNRGLAVYIEWGPARAIPIEQRLTKVLGNLSPKAMKDLIAEYGQIQSTACAIVNDQVERHQTEDIGRSGVAAIDPRLSSDNAAALYTQARVWAARDGLG
jgi:hypothetical protein